MPNINLVVGVTIQAVNVAANVTPVNINLQGITLPSTAYFLDNFFQAGTASTPVALPGATVWSVYVQNLGVNAVTVNYTPTGGGSQSVVLVPVTAGFGGFFFYMQTAETSGGITALSLTAATAPTPCLVYAGF